MLGLFPQATILQHQIDDLKKQLRKYKSLSYHDTLTKLYNRRKFKKDLEHSLEVHKRHHVSFVIILVDLDNFKTYNDTYGHTKGDVLLRKVAKMLKKSVRKTDSVYRYGGDEFTILLPHCCNGQRTGKKIIQDLKEIGVKASIGWAYLKDQKIMDWVDKQLYKDKRRKKNDTKRTS